jgi:hypothetical protein
LSLGLPLTAKICPVAAASSALAANPYTVSVGIPTGFPAFRAATAGPTSVVILVSIITDGDLDAAKQE